MHQTYPRIRNHDLYQNKYSPEQIEYSIRNRFVSLRVLHKTQRLTPYICAKYVIFGGNDEKYGDCEEDRYLADGDILEWQPHITSEELYEAHMLVAREEENEENEKVLMGAEDKSA